MAHHQRPRAVRQRGRCRGRVIALAARLWRALRRARLGRRCDGPRRRRPAQYAREAQLLARFDVGAARLQGLHRLRAVHPGLRAVQLAVVHLLGGAPTGEARREALQVTLRWSPSHNRQDPLPLRVRRGRVSSGCRAGAPTIIAPALIGRKLRPAIVIICLCAHFLCAHSGRQLVTAFVLQGRNTPGGVKLTQFPGTLSQIPVETADLQ